MKTIKIYKVESTKAYVASVELGRRLSMAPWGHNTEHYEGSDDGGVDYKLPLGYEMAESKSGSMEIYNAKGEHCQLVDDNGPVLVSLSESILLVAYSAV